MSVVLSKTIDDLAAIADGLFARQTGKNTDSKTIVSLERLRAFVAISAHFFEGTMKFLPQANQEPAQKKVKAIITSLLTEIASIQQAVEVSSPENSSRRNKPKIGERCIDCGRYDCSDCNRGDRDNLDSEEEWASPIHDDSSKEDEDSKDTKEVKPVVKEVTPVVKEVKPVDNKSKGKKVKIPPPSTVSLSSIESDKPKGKNKFTSVIPSQPLTAMVKTDSAVDTGVLGVAKDKVTDNKVPDVTKS